MGHRPLKGARLSHTKHTAHAWSSKAWDCLFWQASLGKYIDLRVTLQHLPMPSQRLNSWALGNKLISIYFGNAKDDVLLISLVSLGDDLLSSIDSQRNEANRQASVMTRTWTPDLSQLGNLSSFDHYGMDDKYLIHAKMTSTLKLGWACWSDIIFLYFVTCTGDMQCEAEACNAVLSVTAALLDNVVTCHRDRSWWS